MAEINLYNHPIAYRDRRAISETSSGDPLHQLGVQPVTLHVIWRPFGSWPLFVNETTCQEQTQRPGHSTRNSFGSSEAFYYNIYFCSIQSRYSSYAASSPDDKRQVQRLAQAAWRTRCLSKSSLARPYI